MSSSPRWTHRLSTISTLSSTDQQRIPSQILKQGYLVKAPPLNIAGKTKALKRWRRRWCVLRIDSVGRISLTYYKHEDAFLKNKSPQGVVMVDEAFACFANAPYKNGKSRKRKFLWSLHLPRRKYLLATESNYEMQNWVKAIYLAVPRLQPPDPMMSLQHWANSSAQEISVAPLSQTRFRAFHNSCASSIFDGSLCGDFIEEEAEDWPAPPPSVAEDNPLHE